MTTKGEIQSINLLGNTCTVRIPFFESASDAGTPIITEATFATSPGSYNGYKEGDVVFVAFENGLMDKPVVIGKLYLGASNSSENATGAINCSDLTATNSASLPITTQLTNNTSSTRVNIEGDYSDYTKIKDIIDKIKQNTTEISKLTQNNLNIFKREPLDIGSWFNKNLYRYTFEPTDIKTSIVNLSQLNFDLIWLDTANSFIIKTQNGKQISNKPLAGTINLVNKTITIDGFEATDIVYLTVNYTKK